MFEEQMALLDHFLRKKAHTASILHTLIGLWTDLQECNSSAECIGTHFSVCNALLT